MRDEFNAKDRNTINRETCNVDLKDLEGVLVAYGGPSRFARRPSNTHQS